VTDSQAALALFSGSPEDYDLVVTDLTMPKMTGVVPARRVKAIRPDVPVIICTGYSDSLSAGEVSDAGIDYLLMKPLEIRELSASIRNALDGRGTDEESSSY
jgi:DNA-binding response OmpR family regulator